MFSPEEWRKIDLECFSVRARDYRRGLFQLEKDGTYIGFAVDAVEICDLLSQGEVNRGSILRRKVYSLTFPRQITKPKNTEEWKESKAFENLCPELNSLAGKAVFCSVESIPHSWRIIRICTLQNDDIRERIKCAIYPDHYWNSLLRCSPSWAFFSRWGDEFDNIAEQASVLKSKSLAYQEGAILGLLELVYRLGQRDESAIRAERALNPWC